MEAKLFVIFTLVALVQAVPIDNTKYIVSEEHPSEVEHIIAKRFINPSLPFGDFSQPEFHKYRTKRSSEEEDCEKLRLCRLHAHSARNFFSAFELYFVNKENARLWDHHAHSISECNRLYACYR